MGWEGVSLSKVGDYPVWTSQSSPFSSGPEAVPFVSCLVGSCIWESIAGASGFFEDASEPYDKKCTMSGGGSRSMAGDSVKHCHTIPHADLLIAQELYPPDYNVGLSQLNSSSPLSPTTTLHLTEPLLREGVLGATPEDCLPLSPKNSVGSDLDLLLLDPGIDLVPLTMDRGLNSSPPMMISPSSKSNVTIRRGKGRPRIKKRSISMQPHEGFLADGNFRDIPVTQALSRVLRVVEPSMGGTRLS